MRSIWKGTISFGLVNIPIALGIATKRSDPSFRTLDRETLQPIKQQFFSPVREQVIDREETVKGYEVSKDRYVVITDDELDSVAVERRRTIDIVAFVDADEIDPVYFDRTYLIQPQEHAEKPYALLLQAMKETGKAALGKIVLSSREHLALLRPAGDALVVELLFYPEDVRPREEVEDQVRDTNLERSELDMARQLVESLSRPFEPAEFENEHKREVMGLIEKKLAGEEVAIAPEAPAPAPVPDLMSALKASLEQAKGDKPRGTASTTAAAAEPGSDGADTASEEGSNGAKPKRRSSSKGGSRSKSGSGSNSGSGSKGGSRSKSGSGSKAG